MITSAQINQLVRYYIGNGWHVGTLVALEKGKTRFTAIIRTPIVGQRKKRVPAEDCEIYQEEK